MIDETFVSAILDSAAPRVLTVGGKEYATAALHEMVPQEFKVEPISLHSLDGLVEYVKENKDGLALTAYQIVCGFETAAIIGPPSLVRRMRETMAVAHCNAPFKPMSCFTDLEDFRIWLMTNFEDSPDRAAVLKFVSSLTDSAVTTSTDDGVSQSVEAKVGLATVANVTVPSPVTLKPIRTFAEIEQPDVPFLFRLRRNPKMEAGLFECAANWKRAAAVAVAAHLKEKLPEMTVLA